MKITRLGNGYILITGKPEKIKSYYAEGLTAKQGNPPPKLPPTKGDVRDN